MIYQFEHEEIKRCRECPCRFIIDHACSPDWCSLQGCAVTVDDTPQDNDCPMVAISKTCDDTYSQCEECGQFYLDHRGYDYCPNCGRKLD